MAAQYDGPEPPARKGILKSPRVSVPDLMRPEVKVSVLQEEVNQLDAEISRLMQGIKGSSGGLTKSVVGLSNFEVPAGVPPRTLRR